MTAAERYGLAPTQPDPEPDPEPEPARASSAAASVSAAMGCLDQEEEEEDEFDVHIDVESADGSTEAVTVKSTETLGSVKRRMSLSMGLTPEQMAVLLGTEEANDDESIGASGVITAETRIRYDFLSIFDCLSTVLRLILVCFDAQDAAAGGVSQLPVRCIWTKRAV